MHTTSAVLAGQFHGFLAVGGLTNDLITVVFQHGDQIHAVHGFVLGHDNGTRTVLGLGLALSDSLSLATALSSSSVSTSSMLILGSSDFFLAAMPTSFLNYPTMGFTIISANS